ncbi:hypothetical protein IPC1135_29845 [Pseudomonas aeruginosa]|uniref:hypothetical protein n=1 Tax=Pseudomonas aeruginosa TaxID=287 RepID=UPI000FC43A3B|nr:hypothetical protein [Pseudomonas aeruginosa]RUE86371.1 hypothetical protein IPC1135_29845 [Pseudomonas aeruginosa]
MRYPSDIVDQVLKASPDKGLLTWEGEEVACSHCSRPIQNGDLYSPSSVGAFFSDTRDLASTSRSICWRCVVLRKKTMLNALGAVVVTLDGVYSIAKDVNKAWLFTSPPPAPFLVVHKSSTMQHLCWRTPVTLDNRRISVRYGPNLFIVRPEVVRKALSIADRVNEGQKKWVTPVFFDRKAAAMGHGLITRAGAEMLTQEEQDFFQSITPGERWALSYLMHSKRPEPEVGECITEKVMTSLNKE